MGVYSKTTERVQSYKAARDFVNKFHACLRKKIPPSKDTARALSFKVQIFPDGAFLISADEHTGDSYIFYDVDTNKTYRLHDNMFGVAGWVQLSCDEEDTEKSWSIFQQRRALYRLMGITV